MCVCVCGLSSSLLALMSLMLCAVHDVVLLCDCMYVCGVVLWLRVLSCCVFVGWLCCACVCVVWLCDWLFGVCD